TAPNGTPAAQEPTRFGPQFPAPGASRYRSAAPLPPPPPAPARFGPREAGQPDGPAVPMPEEPPRVPLRASGSPAAFAPAPAAVAVPSAPPRPGPIEIERLQVTHLPAVLNLINADLPPGQPVCDRQALDMALRGESFVDAAWWRELANVQAVVA